MRQDAAEVEAVIGPDRKERLIQAAADRIVLQEGMSAEDARRYVDQTWPDTAYIVAPGQVWQRRAGKRDAMLSALGHGEREAVTVVSVDRWERHVVVDDGRRSMDYTWYLPHHYDLVAWPADCQPGVDAPQPPAASAPPPEEQATSEDEEERFDPHHLYVAIHRTADWDIEKMTPYLPMVGEHWTCQPIRHKETGEVGFYVTDLDVPAYLDAHLSNYRDGWPDYAARWRSKDAWDSFNELSFDGFETDVTVAAYLGHWLYGAIQGEVIREHAGKPDEYEVTFMWGGHHADAIIAAYPHADPRVELPVTHRLNQCEGQGTLL